MNLSIIIVSYNVKHFLDQCLQSVMKAIEEIEAEVLIIDNNSSDDSCYMIKEKFPNAILIENKENVGYAKANNQALKIANGKYKLLLNPDTILQEETLKKCIDFMEKNKNAGALTVKMIDGNGKFMPESKRSFPSPLVAFFKTFGFSSIFPKSKLFGKYHLGYLDENKIHKIEVLSGAFMFIRNSVIERIGLLDEDFFMYGEDIDYSYRMHKEGFDNYYFPKSSIIHFKGESTKKSSINYLLLFYKAMLIFANKHFGKTNATLFSIAVKIAIYFRALISAIKRVFIFIFLPTIDFATGFAGMIFLKNYWEANHKFVEGGEYPIEFILYAIPSYLIIWILSIFLSGGYKKSIKIFKLFRGVFLGTIAILVIYALLPESMRFSRALIALGAIWIALSFSIVRFLFSYFSFTNLKISSTNSNRLLIVADSEEANRLKSMINQSFLNIDFLAICNDSRNNVIGKTKDLPMLVDLYKISEVIFSLKNIQTSKIIEWMEKLSNYNLSMKISIPNSNIILGSNSKNTQGEFYGLEKNSIISNENKFKKRILDLLICSLLFITYPIVLLYVEKKNNLFKNIIKVSFGKKTWVGYINTSIDKDLPKIKSSIISIAENYSSQLNILTSKKLNYYYAKNYSIYMDIETIFKNVKKISN